MWGLVVCDRHCGCGGCSSEVGILCMVVVVGGVVVVVHLLAMPVVLVVFGSSGCSGLRGVCGVLFVRIYCM